MLVDEARIRIEAGKGGDGVVSFRHEKYVDKGGPDGGDGGRGGNIIFKSSTDINTLNDYARLKQYKAESGENGAKAKRFGAAGEDLILKVPVGTIISDLKTGEIIYDFQKTDELFVAAKGGKGGLGNVHFKSATNRVPREFGPGEPGEEKNLQLELKLVADIGLIGLPNAGKSTLISAISNAKPKIANYPFTTIEPNLGVVRAKGRSFTVCDIPGLIEGASQGKGLGYKFLRHISRTKILVHLIDSTSDDYERDYQTIRNELSAYDQGLEKKKEIIVLTKIDLTDKIDQKFHYDIAISSATHKNIAQLIDLILAKI
jgi:GTP-binding protein